MVTCHGGKGGRTLEEKSSDSKMATTSIVHLRQERFTTLHIANLLLLWNFWAFSCNVKKLVLRRQIRRQKNPNNNPHLTALKLFLFRAMSTFLCTLYTCVLHHCPSVACAIMIRGKKCLNEISAPQLPCRLPTRTCQLLPDQHPHDWKITTHIHKHWHRCERALLKSTELSSIRFKYC